MSLTTAIKITLLIIVPGLLLVLLLNGCGILGVHSMTGK